VISINEDSLGQSRTRLNHFYVHVFVQNESKDWPECEDSGITELKIGVKDRNGNIVKYTRKDDLNN
jgi:hypothetical protein